MGQRHLREERRKGREGRKGSRQEGVRTQVEEKGEGGKINSETIAAPHPQCHIEKHIRVQLSQLFEGKIRSTRSINLPCLSILFIAAQFFI